jgi:hypothetical protein
LTHFNKEKPPNVNGISIEALNKYIHKQLEGSKFTLKYAEAPEPTEAPESFIFYVNFDNSITDLEKTALESVFANLTTHNVTTAPDPNVTYSLDKSQDKITVTINKTEPTTVTIDTILEKIIDIAFEKKIKIKSISQTTA